MLAGFRDSVLLSGIFTPMFVLSGIFTPMFVLSGIFTPLFVSPPKLGQALAAKLPEMLCNTGNLE